MTDAQTEARAIVASMNVAFRTAKQYDAAVDKLATALAAKDADSARLYDSHAFMADGEIRMTVAEDVLAWLLIEKIGVPDDQNYTPDMAQQILAAAIDGRNAAEAQLAEAIKALDLAEPHVVAAAADRIAGSQEAYEAICAARRAREAQGGENG